MNILKNFLKEVICNPYFWWIGLSYHIPVGISLVLAFTNGHWTYWIIAISLIFARSLTEKLFGHIRIAEK